MKIEEMSAELIRLRHREHLCARTFKGKTLLVIDHLLANIESEDKLLNKLYRFAHCATGICDNPHPDWIKEVEETYQALKGADKGDLNGNYRESKNTKKP